MIVNTETEAVWLVEIELATYNRSLLVSCQMASAQLELNALVILLLLKCNT